LTFVLPRSAHKRRLILWGCGIAVGLMFAAKVWLLKTDAWVAICERFGGNLQCYFCEQMIVFWRYIGLAVWPSPGNLNVDHAVACRPNSLAAGDVLLSTAALVLLVLAPAIYLVRKKPVVSFLLLTIPLGVLPYFGQQLDRFTAAKRKMQAGRPSR
jgi:hypothetical protein